MELAYDIQALLDGYGVPKQKYRNIALWNNDGSRIANSDGGINVQELGFEQADIGGETWNASIVLARKIARGAVNVTGHCQCIELGCGTGLLGFTVAHVFAESSGIGYSNASMKSDRVVVMTDYLPTIMAAVKEGAKKNGFFGSGLVKPALLDWFGIVEQAQLMKDRDHVPLPRTHYLSESEINDLPNDHVTISNLDPAASKGCFDLVVAADVLYEVEHCLVIPRLVDFLLAPAPDHNAGTGDLTVIPKFIVTTSLRTTHWAEVAAFEAEMASIPSLVLLSKHDSSRLSDMEEWVETLGVSHADMVEEAQDKWTDLQKSMDQDKEECARHYRTYMFGRQALA
ncbi:hypothetical protein EV175_002666 [Coemansia sp. RSA 1933]|nr:hypothetical protein EV175_002666 [Coemansia sp. RSA 1933]